jgi:hypothetical protein
MVVPIDGAKPWHSPGLVALPEAPAEGPGGVASSCAIRRRRGLMAASLATRVTSLPGTHQCNVCRHEVVRPGSHSGREVPTTA